MNAVFYWDMTYGEIVAAINAYRKRMEAEARRAEEDMRIRAFIAYKQADLTSSMVAKSFGGKHQVPSIYEAFPGIFPEPVNKQQNWQLMKARIEQYAAEKRKRGEKHGDDTGRAAGADHSEDGGSA